MLGFAQGKYLQGDNIKDSDGVGMTSGNLQLMDIDKHTASQGKGGYVLLTDYGARLGYVHWGNDVNIHHCIVCSSGGITLMYENQLSNEKMTATLNATGWHTE